VDDLFERMVGFVVVVVLACLAIYLIILAIPLIPLRAGGLPRRPEVRPAAPGLRAGRQGASRPVRVEGDCRAGDDRAGLDGRLAPLSVLLAVPVFLGWRRSRRTVNGSAPRSSRSGRPRSLPAW
jgi:hypothetical protein